MKDEDQYKEALGQILDRLYPNRWRIREFLMFDLVGELMAFYEAMENE